MFLQVLLILSHHIGKLSAVESYWYILLEGGVMMIRNQLIAEVDSFHICVGTEPITSQYGGECFSKICIKCIDDRI